MEALPCCIQCCQISSICFMREYIDFRSRLCSIPSLKAGADLFIHVCATTIYTDLDNVMLGIMTTKNKSDTTMQL